MPTITWKVKSLCLLAGLLAGAATAARGQDGADYGIVRISSEQPADRSDDAGATVAPYGHLGFPEEHGPHVDPYGTSEYIHRPPIYYPEGTECCPTGNPILDWWRRHTTKLNFKHHQKRLQRDARDLADWAPHDHGCPCAHAHVHPVSHQPGSEWPVFSAAGQPSGAPALADHGQDVRRIDALSAGHPSGEHVLQVGGHHPEHGHGAAFCPCDHCECQVSKPRHKGWNPFKRLKQTHHGDWCDHCQAYHGGKGGLGAKLGRKHAAFKECLACKFGFLHHTGCCGHGCPWAGSYGIAYPVNPDYFDPRDGRVYAAQGFGAPMAVPLAPNVGFTYNYGWGIPSSRITPVSRHYPPYGGPIILP